MLASCDLGFLPSFYKLDIGYHVPPIVENNPNEWHVHKAFHAKHCDY
jgi:hypothetical protein